MFQGLKSHKPEFADELVRSNKKGPPSEPSTYHKCAVYETKRNYTSGTPVNVIWYSC